MEESELNYIKVEHNPSIRDSTTSLGMLKRNVDDQRRAKNKRQQLQLRLPLPSNRILPSEPAHQEQTYILRSSEIG